MVVCKFFQQGYCRYGQTCRFEHVYGSKYTYHAPQHTQAPPPTQAPACAVTDDQLVKQVFNEVQTVLNGSQWILSSYAPFKEKPALPGFSEMSFEEARLLMYEAKAANNIDQAVAYMNNLFKETRAKYEQLLQPTPTLVKVLRSLYNGERVSSPFENVNAGQGFGSANTAASVFRSATQNTSVFGQPANNTASSIFGQKANNVFGSSNPDPAKSIFSQATQNVFGTANQNQNFVSPTQSFGSPTQNAFGTSENVAAKSIFAQANQNSFQPVQAQSNPTNVFATAAQQHFSQPSDVFKQASPFQNTTPQTNVFQQTQHANNIFGVPQQNDNDSGVYSNPEDLSSEEMEAYTSDSFTLGFIPELPPPQQLCI